MGASAEGIWDRRTEASVSLGLTVPDSLEEDRIGTQRQRTPQGLTR